MSDLPDLLLPRHDGSAYPYSTLQIKGIVLIVVLTFIAIIASGLRVYSWTITKVHALDDWLIWAATLLTINQCWACILFMRRGYIGVHMADIPPHEPGDTWLWNWLAQVFYTPILGLVKNSVLVFLLRLGGRQKRGVRMAIYGLLAFNTVQCIAVTAFVLFRCTPVHLAWSVAYYSRVSIGHCDSLREYAMAVGSLNIFTAALVLILPFLIFLDLNINKKLRNALIGVFLLGLAVPIFSCVRLYYFYVDFYVPSDDPTYSLGYAVSAVESNVAITVASIPALWPVARRWFPWIDDKLGVNRHYQADIEVQTLGDLDPASGSASPPRVKVTWTRADKLRRDGQKHLDSPSLAGTFASRLPSSAFASPMPSPLEKHGEQAAAAAQDGYFGSCGSSGSTAIGGPDRDSYHSMIAASGQPSPWGSSHRQHTVDEAYYSAERSRLERSSTAPTLRMQAFQLAMPPRAKKAPVAALDPVP